VLFNCWNSYELLVSADIEGVNESAGERKFPSAEEGWMRDEKRSREPTEIRADGVVLVKYHKIY